MLRPHVLSLLVGFAALSCSSRQPTSADAGPPEVGDLQRAETMVAAPDIPSRSEALALAQSVEALALREGAGARAVKLHTAAARLTERAFRLEHREQDAKEAVDLYRLASLHLETPGACQAALRLALFAGEVAHDAGRSYAELYRVERRSAPRDAGSTVCPEITTQMALLEPFRPPPSVLAAIDQGLQGEGDVLAGVDAGARVSVAPKILRVEQWSGEEGARLVVTLDRPARFRVGDEASSQGKGARTFIELDGADLGGPARDIQMGGIVTKARAEATVSGARVALDLSGPAYRKVFHLLEPFRVVIDIAKNPPGLLPKGKRTVSRIVLDPGHGGTDPGAIGPAGTKEKDVTLDIAHRAAPVLAKLGLQVTLTRDDDRFIPLEERTARANSFGADLFISIHCNASPFRLEVILAVRPWTLDELPTTLRALEAVGIPVTLWPMLEDAHGRWASVYNAHEFAALVTTLGATLERADLPPHPVLFDLEPPIDVVARLGQWAGKHGGPLRSIKALVSLLSLPVAVEPGCALEDSMRSLRDRDIPVLSAVAPMVALDGRERGPYARALGTPSLDSCAHVSVMAYTSMMEGWSRRILSRRDAVSVLSLLATRSRARWGTRAALSLGTVGIGALGDEPCYRSPGELALDVAVAESAGISDLSLFELRGVLERDPEAWLRPFTEDTARITPDLSRRSRLLMAALSFRG